MNDKLGDRMKEYEKNYDFKLPKKHQVIVRLDGKAFHTLTVGMERPFDARFIRVMQATAYSLMTQIQNCKCAYTQSDEISLLLDDTAFIETDAWFGNKLQKIVSVSASMATAAFNHAFKNMFPERKATGLFDSRAFILPKDDVANYFIWRQRDWNRNSLQMLARVHFSAKQLDKKKTSDIHDMLSTKGEDWNLLIDHLKNGSLMLNTDVLKELQCVKKFNYEIFNKFLGWDTNEM